MVGNKHGTPCTAAGWTERDCGLPLLVFVSVFGGCGRGVGAECGGEWDLGRSLLSMLGGVLCGGAVGLRA